MVLAGSLAGTFGFWLGWFGYGSGGGFAAALALPALLGMSMALPRLGRGCGGCGMWLCLVVGLCLAPGRSFDEEADHVVTARPHPLPSLPGGDLRLEPTEDSLEARQRGQSLFASRCASCHSTARLIGPSPGIVDLTRPWLYKCGAGELNVMRTLKYGIPDTAMRPFRLSDDQLWDLTHFVTALQR